MSADIGKCLEILAECLETSERWRGRRADIRGRAGYAERGECFPGAGLHLQGRWRQVSRTDNVLGSFRRGAACCALQEPPIPLGARPGRDCPSVFLPPLPGGGWACGRGGPRG